MLTTTHQNPTSGNCVTMTQMVNTASSTVCPIRSERGLPGRLEAHTSAARVSITIHRMTPIPTSVMRSNL